MIYQTRDNNQISQEHEIENKSDYHEQNLAVLGMMNHAPTDWMLMKNSKITLGKIVRYFKARTSKIIHDSIMENFKWQRSFYDHIIRNDRALNNIREYIINNVEKWDDDTNNIKNYQSNNIISGMMNHAPTK
ncbi:MAG: transposase [Candidatus Omnitrophota bacterium]